MNNKDINGCDTTVSDCYKASSKLSCQAMGTLAYKEALGNQTICDYNTAKACEALPQTIRDTQKEYTVQTGEPCNLKNCYDRPSMLNKGPWENIPYATGIANSPLTFLTNTKRRTNSSL